MWIKRKHNFSDALTAKSKPNYLSRRNCAIYQGYNKKAKQRPKKLKTSWSRDHKFWWEEGSKRRQYTRGGRWHRSIVHQLFWQKYSFHGLPNQVEKSWKFQGWWAMTSTTGWVVETKVPSGDMDIFWKKAFHRAKSRRQPFERRVRT